MNGTAASLYRETLKQYAAQTVTYKKLGMDRFVVSGIHDRKVFYRVGTTAGKGNTQIVGRLTAVYPVARKAAFDPDLSRMQKRFRTSIGSIPIGR